MYRKFFVFIILVMILGNFCFADAEDDTTNLYTVFANVIREENFPFPLIGFFNISLNNQILPQIGFVNYNGGNFKSLQLGFINSIKKDAAGAQIGFINCNGGNFIGPQFGFANVVTERFSGVQFGFINYIDTLESGIPIGFLSYVKNGGYHAVELSATQNSFVNFSLKLGVEKFYSSIIVSYDDDSSIYCNFGVGIGSKIPVYKGLFINPEINYASSSWDIKRHNICTDILIGYNILKQLSVVAGPDFTLQISDKAPLYSMYDKGDKYFIIGGKLGIRYEW